MIKQYFIDKLKENTRKIESYKKDIIQKVQDMNINELNKMSESLKKLQEENRQLTKDCVKYCTVLEVIEISNTKSFMGDENIISFNKYELESSYKYDKAITVEERNLLVARFGYSLKEAKIV